MKKIVKIAIAAVIVVSASLGGVSTSVMAANTADSAYAFHNSSEVGYCSWRDKNDSSKVYVHPTSGPAIYYTVQGSKNRSTAADRSGSFLISVNVQASITNSVSEKHESYARLKFKRRLYASEVTRGVWSPDSTRNYTVY